jgi:hypothetical protein
MKGFLDLTDPEYAIITGPQALKMFEDAENYRFVRPRPGEHIEKLSRPGSSVPDNLPVIRLAMEAKTATPFHIHPTGKAKLYVHGEGTFFLILYREECGVFVPYTHSISRWGENVIVAPGDFHMLICVEAAPGKTTGHLFVYPSATDPDVEWEARADELCAT